MDIKSKIKLPRISLFNPFENEDKLGLLCWNEYYGGINIARKYCRLWFFEKKKNYFLWYHGVIAPWEDSCELLTYNKVDKECKYFVATKEQEDILKKNGYKNVYSIGLPIIYLKSKKIKRYSKTMLIMPSHTLFGEKIINKKILSDFLDLVLFENKLHNQFDQKNILVCLHSNDIQNGYWLEELKDRGLSYVQGASNNDINAYKRQMYLFSQFETMVTNNFGSHVAYALFFGVKVCIKDMTIITDPTIDSTFNLLPNKVKALSDKKRIIQRDYLNKFYCNLNHSKSDVQLGEYLVGKSNKITKNRMKILFDWK